MLKCTRRGGLRRRWVEISSLDMPSWVRERKRKDAIALSDDVSAMAGMAMETMSELKCWRVGEARLHEGFMNFANASSVGIRAIRFLGRRS